ncbi:hypothetical protein C8R42DRAFT_729871 [Lentinula raphanica]|nr:hypothetical protein C8R42DRAFT_729871 [Lentinula raphanica]
MQEEDTIQSKSTPSELMYYQSRNQTANNRKRLHHRQRERDEADEELRQQLQQEEMEAEHHARDEQIQAQIEASVEERHQALVDESMKQRAIIQELRDQILHKDENFQDSTWEKLEKVWRFMPSIHTLTVVQFLQKYLGIPVTLYPTQPGMRVEYIRILKELEQLRKAPLESSDPQFPVAQTTFIHEVGLHIGVNEDTLDFLWQMKVTYTRASEGFAFVGEQYASRLTLLFPQEYYRLCNFAIENHIPSFADLELWANSEPGSTPFANSLTITNCDFANYVHRDWDAIDITYGWWWTAFKPRQCQPWQLNEEHDHGDIKGGEFLIAEYGIAFDFSKTKGLVEIFWRGHKDYHVTMRSTSPQDVTRFGTSVQITQSALRGVQALERHENDPNRVIDHHQRTHDAEEAIKRQQRKQAQKKKKSVV